MLGMFGFGRGLFLVLGIAWPPIRFIGLFMGFGIGALRVLLLSPALNGVGKGC